MKFKNLYILFFFAILANACITPFDPKGFEQQENILVIEGDIITNQNSEFMISRSIKLSAKPIRNFITGATVWVEDNTGLKYMATQVNGTEIKYVAQTTNLNMSRQYKLCVITPDKKRYETPLMRPLDTPEIENVNFDVDSVKKAVTFSVTTSSPNPELKFYKWTYQEDWEVHANTFATVEFDPLTKTIKDLDYYNNKFYCWGTSKSSEIILFNTSNLSQNRVYKRPLTRMDWLDRKISVLYSIEVFQKSISAEAHMFWETLKKNTNETGDIFSPQPSELRGNIRNIANSSEIVLGYISASKMTKKRVFATEREINLYKNLDVCEVVEEKVPDPKKWLGHYEMGYDVIQYFRETGESMWVFRNCADCRMYGTKKKPVFWPNDHI